MITHLNPVYDACFAPLRHKHQYWFGVLLLARVILLGTFSISFAVPQNTNLLILLISVAVLSFYMARSHPYKHKVIFIVNNSFFFNLTILSGFDIFACMHPNAPTLHAVAIGISIVVAFLQFCGIMLYLVLGTQCSTAAVFKHRKTEPGNVAPPQPPIHEVGFRDSILNSDSDTEPLLPTY